MISGNHVREIRRNLNLSQEAMAQQIGISTRTLSRWESGAVSPSSSSIDALGKFLYQRARRALPLKVLQRFYKLRRDAAFAVGKEISQGRLLRISKVSPLSQKAECVDCGKRADCYDHRDYTKPLAVEPVCQSCNFKRGFAIYTLPHIWKLK